MGSERKSNFYARKEMRLVEGRRYIWASGLVSLAAPLPTAKQEIKNK